MNVWLIAKRDFAAYLHGYTGYVIIAAVLFIEGLFFIAHSYLGGPMYSHEVLERFFEVAGGLTMIATPLLTMRSLAEERATGTHVLLQTSPVRDSEVVAGKYLAAMGVLGLMTALTLYMPGMIFVNGKVSMAHIAVGYMGLMCLGSAVAAIGIFGSSLFRSQVAAAILSGVMIASVLTAWILSQVTDPPFEEVLAYAALWDRHFIPFMEGRLASTSLVYYGTVTFGFLLLATRVLEGRRWE